MIKPGKKPGSLIVSNDEKCMQHSTSNILKVLFLENNLHMQILAVLKHVEALALSLIKQFDFTLNS